jgi:hypothetical protein
MTSTFTIPRFHLVFGSFPDANCWQPFGEAVANLELHNGAGIAYGALTFELSCYDLEGKCSML